MRSALFTACLICALALAQVAAQPRFTPQDAARFQSKLSRILFYGTTPPRAPKGQTVQVTDAEVNAYLRFAGAGEVPVGITEPTLTAAGNGRITGRAIVDLDAVRTQRTRGWADPMGYLTGKLPVTAAGTLTTHNGVGRFTLESAAISGVPIPKPVLQELLSYYSRSPEQPSGINMDDPFKLPARIKDIQVGQGVATIVQ